MKTHKSIEIEASTLIKTLKMQTNICFATQYETHSFTLTIAIVAVAVAVDITGVGVDVDVFVLLAE